MNFNGQSSIFESNEDEFNEIFKFLKTNEAHPESTTTETAGFDVFSHGIDRRSPNDENSLEIERPMTSTSTLFSYNVEDTEDLDININFEWSQRGPTQRVIPQLMDIKVDESKAKVHIFKTNAMQQIPHNIDCFGRQCSSNRVRHLVQRNAVDRQSMLRNPSFSNSLFLVEGNPSCYPAYRPRSYSETISSKPQVRSRQRSMSEEANGCGYCRALGLSDFANHSKRNCLQLQLLPPCKCCNASGAENHTETYCPRKQPVYLDLCPDYLTKWEFRNLGSKAFLTGLMEESYAEWKKSESGK